MRLPWFEMKKRRDALGYAFVGLTRHGTQFNRKVPRLVLDAFICSCPEGMEACHNNNIRDDDRLDNLRWDTHKANCADKKRHGTAQTGDNNPMAKLRSNQIPDVRRMHASGMSKEAIGRHFGVTGAAIHYVIAGVTWNK